jgi:Family of unknown function (DUF5681)
MMSESDSNDDDLADEKVGYKKPPKATRFRKGQSGNPSGRPKKTSSLRESFREELSGPMLFKIGGEVKPFDSREAYARALVKSARRGSIADIKIILECDQAGDLAGALAEQQRQYGILVVPEPVESEEEWERLYGADAQDAAVPKR